MLIRAIRAENFMRFSRLRIENLPGEGIIGIEGPNESGKTTLGEILLFAFFGRTRLSVDSPLLSLIRWGADSMSAEVEFVLQGMPGAGGIAEGEYLIFRQVDRYGTNYVKIVSLPDRAEIASGNVRASEFIAKNVGFDALEFQRSFYHDQYEIRRVETGQVAFFEAATGIRHLGDAAKVLRDEMEPLEREFSYYQKDIARNQSQIEKHARNVAKLPDLTSRLRGLESSIEEMRAIGRQLEGKREALLEARSALDARAARLDRLEEKAPEELERLLAELQSEEESAQRRLEELIQGDKPEEHCAAIRRGLAELLDAARAFSSLRRRISEERGLLLEEARREEDRRSKLEADLASRGVRVRRSAARCVLCALLAGALLPGFASWAIRSLRAGRVEALLKLGGSLELPSWVQFAAPAALGLGALGSLVGAARQLFRVYRDSAHRAALRLGAAAAAAAAEKLSEEAARLESLLRFARLPDLPELVSDAQASGNPRIATVASEVRERIGDLLGEHRISSSAKDLLERYRGLRGAISAAISRRERELSDNEAARKRLESDRCRLENEIRECEAEGSKKEALEEKNRELEHAAALVRAEIDRRRLACGLLEETAASMRSEMGPTLTHLVKLLLARLTLGRYRDARVEPNLELKVYSSEKNDFLSLHELSGGTNEALSLALRLAVSQALVWTRARQSQFVFLDEPFKMMDPERSAETLQVLQRLSPSLRQFFIIQPEFPEKARASLRTVIRTSREGNSLEVDCG